MHELQQRDVEMHRGQYLPKHCAPGGRAQTCATLARTGQDRAHRKQHGDVVLAQGASARGALRGCTRANACTSTPHPDAMRKYTQRLHAQGKFASPHIASNAVVSRWMVVSVQGASAQGAWAQGVSVLIRAVLSIRTPVA